MNPGAKPPAGLAATGEPTPLALPAGAPRYWRATRPAFLGITVMGVLLGFASAWHDGIRFDAVLAALSLLFALAAHAGANVINDYHDRDGDALNVDRVYPFTGGSRFIQNGVLSAEQTRRLGHGLLAAVIVAGLWLTTQAGAGLLLIGLVGMFAGWAYSAPPLRLSARGLGEVAIIAGWLVLVLGADYVLRGGFAVLPAVAGFGFAAMVAAILYINQFPDVAADAASGKRTLVVRLGRRAARGGYLLLLVLAYGSVPVGVASAVLPAPTLAVLLALPFSLAAARDLWHNAERPANLVAAIRHTIVAAHLFAALLAAALLIAKAIS
jgi:1,4-dihydroxy-2-naphthoate octaprenyltransferase